MGVLNKTVRLLAQRRRWRHQYGIFLIMPCQEPHGQFLLLLPNKSHMISLRLDFALPGVIYTSCDISATRVIMPLRASLMVICPADDISAERKI
jgi:hypothetical protein